MAGLDHSRGCASCYFLHLARIRLLRWLQGSSTIIEKMRAGMSAGQALSWTGPLCVTRFSSSLGNSPAKSPFSPDSGEKVAGRPDEGALMDSELPDHGRLRMRHKRHRACPGGSTAFARVQCRQGTTNEHKLIRIECSESVFVRVDSWFKQSWWRLCQ